MKDGTSEIGDIAPEKYRFDDIVQEFRLMNWHMHHLHYVIRTACAYHNLGSNQPNLKNTLGSLRQEMEHARTQINHYLLDNGFRELEY
jgi:hypothetical protein